MSDDQCYTCGTGLLLPYFRCITCQNNLQDKLLRRRRGKLDGVSGDNGARSCDQHAKTDAKIEHADLLDRRDYQSIHICSDCFASGAENPPHRNDHDYSVIKKNFSLFEKDWTAKEELTLIDALLEFGIENWNGVSTRLEGKTPEQCRKHYYRYYIHGPSGPLPVLKKVPRTYYPSPQIARAPKFTTNEAYNPNTGEFAVEYSDLAEKRLVKAAGLFASRASGLQCAGRGGGAGIAGNLSFSPAPASMAGAGVGGSSGACPPMRLARQYADSHLFNVNDTLMSPVDSDCDPFISSDEDSEEEGQDEGEQGEVERGDGEEPVDCEGVKQGEDEGCNGERNKGDNVKDNKDNCEEINDQVADVEVEEVEDKEVVDQNNDEIKKKLEYVVEESNVEMENCENSVEANTTDSKKIHETCRENEKVVEMEVKEDKDDEDIDVEICDIDVEMEPENSADAKFNNSSREDCDNNGIQVNMDGTAISNTSMDVDIKQLDTTTIAADILDDALHGNSIYENSKTDKVDEIQGNAENVLDGESCPVDKVAAPRKRNKRKYSHSSIKMTTRSRGKPDKMVSEYLPKKRRKEASRMTAKDAVDAQEEIEANENKTLPDKAIDGELLAKIMEEKERENKLDALAEYREILIKRRNRKLLMREYSMITDQDYNFRTKRYMKTIGIVKLHEYKRYMHTMAADDFERKLEEKHQSILYKESLAKRQMLRDKGIYDSRMAKLYDRIQEQRSLRVDQGTCMNRADKFIKNSEKSNPNKEFIKEKILAPFVIDHLPYYENLTDAEKNFCCENRLVPLLFLDYKATIVKANDMSGGGLTLSHCRSLLKIDVNKTRKIYDFLSECHAIVVGVRRHRKSRQTNN